MIKTTNFSKRIGVVKIPRTRVGIPVHGPDKADQTGWPIRPDSPTDLEFEYETYPPIMEREELWPWPAYRRCLSDLREGCYTLYYTPKSSGFFGPRYRGTLRVEHDGLQRVISGDLYSYRWLFEAVLVTELKMARLELFRDLPRMVVDRDAPITETIPIYARRDYYSYLACTGGDFSTLNLIGNPCWFGLNFDEYAYQQPASGFNGSFPSTPTRSIRFILYHTDTPDLYTGKAYDGNNELGSVSIRWISTYFRRATLEIHTLQGAVTPPSVGGSNFRTVFESANWDLTVNDGGTVSLPDSLVGVQDPNACWSKENSATLMASVPGYDPTELDKVWKAHLLAVPATLNCSRGRMFDNSTGDPNDVPREGAVTHSHDGYPASDSANFGAAEGGLQKDFPRAYLRSAAHEVGHTFNQIHQFYEGGSDNSIMTVTPGVADELAADGLTFPDDIYLGFNDTVREHLIHLPDPAVRPGGMEFFGAAVNEPQAEEINWLDFLVVAVRADTLRLRLGEPLSLNWELINDGKVQINVPSSIDYESLTARISVTDPRGKVTFLRPPNQKTCVRIPMKGLKPKKSVRAETTVFWGRDGFAFESPGRHSVEVILLWDINGVQFGAAGETEVWVDYPLNQKDNQVASLMMHPDVGRAIAFGSTSRWKEAKRRIQEASKLHKSHPVCLRLAKLGLLDVTQNTPQKPQR